MLKEGVKGVGGRIDRALSRDHAENSDSKGRELSTDLGGLSSHYYSLKGGSVYNRSFRKWYYGPAVAICPLGESV